MLVAHALLGLSAVALCAASLRVASLAAPAGLVRALAAAPIAAAAAAIETLALGLAGLSGEPLALAGAAILGWLAARALLSASPVGPAEELTRWWRALTPGQRALAGALAGSGLAFLAWLLRHPLVGEDGITYHVPISATWVQSGHAGSVVQAFYGLPVGNYPLTNDLLMAWAMGISGSLVAVTLWPPLLIVLMAGAAWLGLRTLSVPRLPAAFAVAGLCLLPLVVTQLNEPSSDTAGLAWLVCGAALCAASRERSALLAPAVVALGLAVGTKTTSLPLAAVVLALSLYPARASARRLMLPLGIAALTALGAGGVWYVRNLIDHGSPLWPFVALPWGDPAPRFLEHLRYSLLDRPRVTLEGHVDAYVQAISGGFILLVGAAAAPLLLRPRAVLSASAAAGLALLLWCAAPVTGRGDITALDALPVSTTRYLLPVFAAALLALSLAARDRSAGGRIATLLLAAAVTWSLLDDFQLGFPFTPSGALLLSGAGVGAAVGWAAGRLAVPRPRFLGITSATAVVAGAAALALPASGYIRRQAVTWKRPESNLTAWFVAQPEFAQRGRPIAMTNNLQGALVGDALQHRLELIPPSEPCPDVMARLKRGWVITAVFPRIAIRGSPNERFPQPGSASGCLRQRRPAYASAPTGPVGPRVFVYGPDGGSGRPRTAE